MSSIDIRWNNGEEWVPFPIDTILHMPLRHACYLFLNKPQVVAKQEGQYVVNSDALQKQYRIKRRRVTTFTAIIEKGGERLDKPLREVGFI